MIPKPEDVAQRVIKQLGGLEAARERMEADYQEIRRLWDQDESAIGKVLRSHLFVEHFMTVYIQRTNLSLAPLDGARLSFAQKVMLIDWDRSGVGFLQPGIRHLNKIRNRLAHTLHADVSEADAQVFSAISHVHALQSALAGGHVETDPIAVLEGFARTAGLMLDSCVSDLGQAFRTALSTE